MSKPALEDIFKLSGRRDRKSYITYNALMAIGGICALLVSGWLYNLQPVLGGASVILLLAPILWSSIAAGSQRCRDFGWTGWLILITFIPYIGMIVWVIFMIIPGDQGENRFGPDPLADKNCGTSNSVQTDTVEQGSAL